MNIAWTVIAPGETVPLNVKLFNQNRENLNCSKVHVTVYAPDMSVAREYTCVVENNQETFVFDSFVPDADYTDQCFLVCADLSDEGRLLSRTSYFIKCTSQLADAETYRKHRSEPAENLTFPQGPWLKDGIQCGKKAGLAAELLGKGKIDSYHYFDIRLTNPSDIAAYPVTVEVENDVARFYANDNFFLLKPNEVKQLHLICDGLADGENAQILVGSWNTETVSMFC